MEKTQVTEFFIEQAVEASKLFWIRMNVFLVIQTAWLTGAFVWVAKSPSPSTLVACLFAILGIAFCAIWTRVIRISDWYHDIQVYDARAAAIREGRINEFFCSLHLANHLPDEITAPVVSTKSPYPARPRVGRAVQSMYLVTGVFALAWVVLIVAAASTPQAATPPSPVTVPGQRPATP